MDGFLTAETVGQVKTILASPRHRREMVEHNFKLAARHFSYDVLRQHLGAILAGLLDEPVSPLLSSRETEDAECLLTPALPRPVTQAL